MLQRSLLTPSSVITLMMKVVSFSQMPVSIYQTACHFVPEDSLFMLITMRTLKHTNTTQVSMLIWASAESVVKISADWQTSMFGLSSMCEYNRVFFWQCAGTLFRSSSSEGCKPEQLSRTFHLGIGITNTIPLWLNFEPLSVFWNLYQKKNSAEYNKTYSDFKMLYNIGS
jgi:hypothetical protein